MNKFADLADPENEIQRQVARNLLKWASGHTLTCLKCARILDCARTVQFNLSGHELVTCATCYDQLDNAGFAGTGPIPTEVLDGRLLFPPNPPRDRKNPSYTYPVHAKDVQVGKRYRMNHGGREVTVKVLGTAPKPWNMPGRDYVCWNERTQREIRVKSAAKFIGEVEG
jgi:hypothetical protein